MQKLENAVKDAAKVMHQKMKDFGYYDVTYSHCLEVAAKMAGVANWRVARAALAGQAAEQIRHISLTQDKLRVLVVVSGGVADPTCDDGVDVEVFDWDNYRNESVENRREMAVPAVFRDLAEPLGIPVRGDISINRTFNSRLIALAGKEVVGDSDQPGKFCWIGSDVSYDSRRDAEIALAFVIRREVRETLDVSLGFWNSLTDDQRLDMAKDIFREEPESNETEILRHRIKWWLRGDDVPTKLDDCSIEHIEKCIKEGYNQGELCVIGSDGDTEYHGWWSIEST